MIPLLSTLREPPVPGRFYMVPVISDSGKWFRGEWPVIGPMHHDVDLFPHFPYNHYHIDLRFLTKAQARYIALHFGRGGSALDAVGSHVLHLNALGYSHLPKGLPPLRKRKCQSSGYGYAHSQRDHVGALERQYGAPCKAITRPDGRKLCPHRKVDLSSFPPRPDGTVVCPLHGLTVQIAEPA